MGKFNNIWLTLNDDDNCIYGDYYNNNILNKNIKIIKSDILNNFKPNQILNMLDDKDIELYLRNKKLKKITNKIK